VKTEVRGYNISSNENVPLCAAAVDAQIAAFVLFLKQEVHAR